MGLSEFYGEPDEAASKRCLHDALELGYRHFDTADMYASGRNEELIGAFLSEIGARRRDLVVASKVGLRRDPEFKYRLTNDASPSAITRACEGSLQRLKTDYLDLYYLHRVDPKVPVAESMGALARLVEQGKVRAIGLSEVSAAVLREAHSVHPVAALQSELSLWSRDAEEVLPTCRELGVTFVAFSPLGRGFLTGALSHKAIQAFDPAQDIRALLPRFQSGHVETNLAMVERLRALCEAEGISTSQAALAWVLSRGEHVHAIAGTRTRDHLRSNLEAAKVVLSEKLRSELQRLFAPGTVSGSRYPERFEVPPARG